MEEKECINKVHFIVERTIYVRLYEVRVKFVRKDVWETFRIFFWKEKKREFSGLFYSREKLRKDLCEIYSLRKLEKSYIYIVIEITV